MSMSGTVSLDLAGSALALTGSYMETSALELT